jgi:ABC-type cobalamin/Fe3+-siderophores transport system ATPase subunit
VSTLVAVEHASHSYGTGTAVDDVSLVIEAGEIVALVGPNGAGKTTLLKMLAGLLEPRSGRVVRMVRRTEVAYLAESDELPLDWSVREMVELGRLPHVGLWRGLSKRDDDAVQVAMERTAILSYCHRLLSSLSGGERRRAALARALAQEPRVLLLDEPAAHLDLRHQVELFSMLRQEAARGVGVVVVVHDLGFAARADRCVLLAEGSIRAQGAPAEALRAEGLSEIYGTSVEVLRTSDGGLAIVPAIAREWSSWTEESS